MTPAIEALIDEVIRNEGGDVYTDRPDDRGGPTRAGMTLKTAAGILGRALTVDEFRALPLEAIRDLYRRQFVAPFADLPEPLRYQVVDYAVNSWLDDPVKAIQRFLNEQVGAGLAIDGGFGPKTRATLTAYLSGHGPVLVAAAVLADRLRKHAAEALSDPATRTLMQARPVQLRNLAGWINRDARMLLAFAAELTAR